MKKLLALTVAAALTSAGARGLSGLDLGLSAGYAGGLSGEVYVIKPNVAGPIGVKVSAAYTKPSDNIKDNVDIGVGTGVSLGNFGSYKAQGATEGGSHATLALDGTYNLGEVTPGISVLAYAGGRYGVFKANESLDGKNTTTYTMNSFGVGAGVMASYALAGNVSLVGDLGVDQYFDGKIKASGAASDTYNTGDAGYSNLRSRFAFPGTVFKAKLGVKFSY